MDEVQKDGRQMEQRAAAKRVSGSSAPLHDAGGRRVLVVDDSDAICDVLQLGLIDAGFVVSCARDSSEARRVLNQGRIDVVVLDINMPGESGLLLAEYANGTGAAVILMTGHPNTMTVLDQVAHRRIFKPFRLADLVAAVEEAIHSRRAAPPL